MLEPLCKSGCPIHLSLEVLGDRWTLLILRDMVFAGKRHFREFLRSEEGISSRTLAERLQTLQAEGIITRHDDPSHKRKAVYLLTEAGVEIVPILVSLGVWGSRFRNADSELSRTALRFAEGGKAAIEQRKKKLLAERQNR